MVYFISGLITVGENILSNLRELKEKLGTEHFENEVFLRKSLLLNYERETQCNLEMD